jgi:hypothetical protein
MSGVKLPIKSLDIIVIALIVILCMAVLYFEGSGSPISSSTATESKNAGCRTYLRQQPTACGDWTAFNVTWQGTSMKFSEYMNLPSTYNCADQACARRICSCPGA